MKPLKSIIATVLLIALLSSQAFAAPTTESLRFFESGTNQPVTGVRGVVFRCADTNEECRTVAQPAVIDVNSGTSNALALQFPESTVGIDYGQFFYKPGFQALASVAENVRRNGQFSFDVSFSKKAVCEAPLVVDSPFSIVQEGELLRVTAFVESAFKLSPPPFFVPDEFKTEFYSTQTDVTLTVRDASNTVVFTQTQRANPFTDTVEPVFFSNLQFAPGTYTGEVTTRVVDDQCAATAQRTVAFRTFTVNAAPVLTVSPAGPFTLNEGQTVAFTVSATDGNNDQVTITPSNVPAGASVNAQGVFTWTPSFTQAGTSVITFTATDGRGGSDTEQVTITVNNINRDPVITTTPPTTARQDDSYEYDVNARDDDNDVLTFSFVTAPSTMSINPNSGAIFWLPDNTEVGAHTITVQVSDGFGGVAQQTFVIQVANVNDAPFITSQPVTTGTQNAQYSYDANAFDADSDVLTFALLAGPSGMTINTQTGLILWTPDATQIGQNSVTVQVTDGNGGSGQQSFVITVADQNDAPVITTQPVTTATEDALYIYDVDATDADNDVLTFTLGNPVAGMTINSQTGLITWVPTNQQVGQNTVNVRVNDGRGGIVTQLFSVSVSNNPPVLTNPGTQFATEDVQFTLDLQSTDESEGLTYTLNIAPASLTINSATGVISWLPLQADTGVNTVTVTANDGNGGLDTETFTIRVADINDPPVPGPNSSFIVTEGQRLQFTEPLFDEDGDQVVFSVARLPSGATFDVPSLTFSWVPDFTQAGNYRFFFDADDGNGGLAQGFHDITVLDVNRNPSVRLESDSPRRFNENVNFVATVTDDDTDNVHTFSFDFNGDGSFEVVNSPSNVQAAQYQNPGVFAARVVVRDNTGATAEATTIVEIISNAAPFARIGVASKNVNVNDVVVFDGIQSFDPDGTVTSFTWNFGDGNTASGNTVVHQYTSGGEFTVTLTVIDNDGAQGSITAEMTVNGPPAAQLQCPATGSIRRGLLIDASQTADDTNGLVFSFDFGDGTGFTSQSAQLLHSYNDPGTYVVRVTATDGAGLASSASCVIAVDVNPPGIDFFFSPNNPATGDKVTFVTNNLGGTGQTFAWDFGDPASGTANTDDGLIAFHTFKQQGTFPVKLTVTDDRGITNSVTKLIAVGLPVQKVSRERLIFSRIQIDDVVSAGQQMPIRLTLSNDAAKGLDDVKITAQIYDLGLRTSLGPFDLKPHEESSKTMLLELPPDVPPGSYDLELRISNDKLKRVTYRTVTIS